MSQLVLGIDGGGTKTHYALFDIEGKLVNFIEGGPSFYEMYPDKYEGVRREFKASLPRLLQPLGLKADQIGYGILGLSGIDTRIEALEYDRIIKETGIGNYKVFNDSFLGIKAGSRKGYGICSINGTGTSCTGIDKKGNRMQIGGGGYYFGDEAGSRHIGSMVIRKVYDACFRGSPRTVMESMLFERLGIASENDLTDAVYEKVYTNDIKVTDFCRIVFEAANLKDEAALDILGRAGRGMAASVLGVMSKLDFSGDDELDVILAGSVSVKGENPTLVDEFKNVVSKGTGKKVNFIILREPPVSGAVIWALEELGIDFGEKLREKIAEALSEKLI